MQLLDNASLRGRAKNGGRWRRHRLLLVVAGALISSLVVVPSASASGDTLRLSGPGSNRMGTDFTYVMTGETSGLADHLVAWEQFNKVSGCATTFAAESARALLDPSTLYSLTLWNNQSVSGTYSVTARFGASHLGVHGICAYLIDLTTGETFATAGAFWTNHN